MMTAENDYGIKSECRYLDVGKVKPAFGLKNWNLMKKNSEQASTLTVTTIVRVLLMVSDPLKAAEWYKAVLGIEPLHVLTEPPRVQLNTQGIILVLHRGRTKRCEDPAYIHFRVDDFDSAVASLRQSGIQLGEIFSPLPSLRIVNFPDPDGNMLGIEGR